MSKELGSLRNCFQNGASASCLLLATYDSEKKLESESIRAEKLSNLGLEQI